jgi:sugar phosphate isomerase/epimerase
MAVALVAKLELRGVLLPLPSLAADPAELTVAEAGRVRQAAFSAGVTVAGLTDVMAGVENRLVGGDTSRAAALARLQAVVRLCTELGARLACFELPAWDALSGKLRPEQARTLAAEVLRRCGPLAESRRVTLCVSGGELGMAEEFVRNVDHPNIRLAWDGAALKQLAHPVRHMRLVRARLGDEPQRLGGQLGSLGYNHWLSLRPDKNSNATVAQRWLDRLRAAMA